MQRTVSQLAVISTARGSHDDVAGKLRAVAA